MKKIVFIVPSLSDSHYKNRISEFRERGYEVDVYGFTRKGRVNISNTQYKAESLGEIEDSGFASRIKLYCKVFKKLARKYSSIDVIYYLGGLDISIFFHLINPSLKYIYEECDLTHTYLGKLKGIFEYLDKKIIRNSLLTITTSEGFINYHFKGQRPENVYLVENKLDPSLLNLKKVLAKDIDVEHLNIGFVGKPRFDSVYNFIDIFCKSFPQHTMHIFGGPIQKQFKPLDGYPNCVFHGFFKNPDDLPDIYSQIDLVLCTYDAFIENVQYAEPNKIYESIYFETPIIVSSGTFLAEKVNRLGIGYDVNAMDENQVVNLVKSLTKESIESKRQAARAIDKNETLNINDGFFKFLKEKLAKLDR